MQSFQYADQMSNPRFIDRIFDDPLPPFKPAWSSREEYEARASQIVEAYPILKRLPSALPEYRPAHMENKNPVCLTAEFDP